MTKEEALDTAARYEGHADWKLAKYKLDDENRDLVMKKAMDIYASQFRRAAVSGALPPIERLEVTRIGKRVEHTDHFPVQTMYVDGKTLKVRFTDGGNDR